MTTSAHKNFPYSNYRPGQREALEAIQNAFNKGKRFVIVEAPTGAGKSGIAITVARDAKSAYILTAQKLLQDQYVRDFPDLSVVKGRANYPCLVMETHAGAAPCMAGRKFAECEDCTYLLAKDDAMHAHTATLNYAYFLAETNHQGGFGKRQLLVLDEAHNCEEMLMRFVEVLVSRQTLLRAGIHEELPAGLALSDRIAHATALLPALMRALGKLNAEIEKLEVVPPDLAVHKSELEGLVSRLRLLNDSENEHETWVCEDGESELGSGVAFWKFRPVRVASFAQDYLFKHGEQILMLSATILDAPTFLRSLGIAPADASFVRIPSSFPAHNRPIYPLNVARLNKDTLEGELPRIAVFVDRLMQRHGHQKGVIHAHSYKVLRYLVEHLPDKNRLVFHNNAQGREEALARHLDSPEPTVLLTPSMTEGIDLHGDLARWQVIVKVPYPYLGDPQISARRQIDPAWYEWRTALTIVQAYGRIVRSAEDTGTTYVLDSLFGWWVGRQRDRLPGWFLEAIAPEAKRNQEQI